MVFWGIDRQPQDDSKDTSAWYIQMSADDITREGAHIYFYNGIQPATSLKLIKTLDETRRHFQKLSIDNDIPMPEKIYLHINSGGGWIDDMFAIVDAIKQSPIKVVGIGEGMVASAATVVLGACNERSARKNTVFLFHQLRGGVLGTYEQIKDDMKILDLQHEMMIDFYKAHSKMTEKQIRDMLSREYWMEPDEAIERGLIDGYYEQS